MLKITRRCRNKGNFVDGFLLQNLSSNGIIVAKGRWNNCQNMKKKYFERASKMWITFKKVKGEVIPLLRKKESL